MQEIEHERFRTLSDDHVRWADSVANGVQPRRGMQLQLSQVKIRGLAITDMNYTCAALNECEFEDCTFTSCTFANAEFICSTFVRSRFERCEFLKTDLSRCIASRCLFRDCRFTRADLTDAQLVAADCSGCSFDWAWLTRTDLRNATLQDVSMRHTRMQRAKVFNTQRFKFAAVDKVTASELDLSPEGNGSLILDWPATIARLSTEEPGDS